MEIQISWLVKKQKVFTIQFQQYEPTPNAQNTKMHSQVALQGLTAKLYTAISIYVVGSKPQAYKTRPNRKGIWDLNE